MKLSTVNVTNQNNVPFSYGNPLFWFFSLVSSIPQYNHNAYKIYINIKKNMKKIIHIKRIKRKGKKIIIKINKIHCSLVV